MGIIFKIIFTEVSKKIRGKIIDEYFLKPYIWEPLMEKYGPKPANTKQKSTKK